MRKMLLKYLVVISLLLITFFSFNVKYVNASYFSYDSFNWEQFLEKNKQQWITSCDEADENCYDRLIKTQEKFYKRLYNLLTKFQRKGYTIDDNILIATTFYGLTPNSFRDPVEGEENPFNLDSLDDSSFIADISEEQSAKDYFDREADSLKMLMNTMVAYTQKCYGITDENPTQQEDGTFVCSGTRTYLDGQCVDVLKTLGTSFFERLGIFGFLSAAKEWECQSLASGYSGYKLGPVSSKKEINEELYWDFLLNGTYFDSKNHLQTYFKHVLENTGHNHMKELTPEEYEKNKEDIMQCRQRIINGIKSVLKTNERTASQAGLMNSKTPTYWWPIGSDEIVEVDGVIYADGIPSSVEIINNYGLNSSTGETHTGIDISGILNSTNVIASKSGVVVKSTKSDEIICPDGSDTECGSGYGNYVIIEHASGVYSLYAHLASGSITVEMGDSVEAGQLIGKVGQSGEATVPHLHFEIRVGGPEKSSNQDPTNYVSADYPRGAQGDIIIPEEYGNSGFFTFTKITNFNWVYNQKKVYELWKQKGAKSVNNIAVIDGRYLIACTSTFGNIGDKIDFYLADGTKIEAIMFDEKSQKVTSYDKNPANMWGHNGGQQIIEFEITHNPNGSGDVGSWTGWSGQRVTSATNLGSNVIGLEPGGIAPNGGGAYSSSKVSQNEGNKYNTTQLKYVDGILIVNKTYSLPKDYVPTNTNKKITSEECKECLEKTTYQQYNTMKSAASASGINLFIVSGYRSYTYQNNLYNNYVNRQGKQAADTFSARAGHSEHQTGLAFDLNNASDSFIGTKEAIWVNSNCYKYGFIIRYPKGKENITGYKYESWHLRYVGVDLATKLYNNGNWITLEEHFNLTSSYSN